MHEWDSHAVLLKEELYYLDNRRSFYSSLKTKGVLETGIAWTIKSLGHGSIFYHQEKMLLVDDKRISARRETSFEGEGTEHT